MKIKELRIRGWRSYSGEEDVVLSDLKHINIIIGPNNAGKSNIFKYLYYLRDLGLRNKAGSKKQGSSVYGIYSNIPESFNSKNTWAERQADIGCGIILEDIASTSQWFSDPPLLHQKFTTINLTAKHNTSEQKTCLSVLHGEVALLEEFTEAPKLYSEETKRYINPVESMDYFFDTYEYWNAFLDTLFFVDPIRHHSRGSSDSKECDFDGSEIVNEIIRIRNEEDHTWRDYKYSLENWLKRILGETEIILDPIQDDLRFYVRRGDNIISAYLSQLGTGVSQLVMLLSFLYINKERVLNVFIEEPECNLHPEAVVQLVSICRENFENHRFFITTHSSALIDQVDDEWSIHRVTRRKDQSSIIFPCKEVIHKYEVLDQLGIRASQLLQSNIVIWVEGPSDRIYLNKWIKDGCPDLLEGRHYSYLMYGGSNLTSFDLLSDEDSIDILSTSRYAIIICDSDKRSNDSVYKGRVQNIIDRIKTIDETKTGDESKISDYIHTWVTSGREIENYIPCELFTKVLNQDEFLRKYVYVNNSDKKEKKKIVFNKDFDAPYGQYHAFDEFFAEQYCFEDGSILEEAEKRKIANDFSKKKSHIAKEIVNSWSKEHFGILDIRERMNEVIQLIKRANSMT